MARKLEEIARVSDRTVERRAIAINRFIEGSRGDMLTTDWMHMPFEQAIVL
jgi:hypothetical protein